ncbi:MAG: exodeoxyribonuclease VII large subunit [Chloroflexota bacterium]|nr:exodeoxyribonuclease VII large subunit [Chloroflexota bacterium]
MPIYTVGQVARYLKESLERDDHLSDLWVSGETSNLVASQAGHLYFTLKDAQSQLRCVMFQGGQGGELLQNGGAVIVHGRIAFYEARGLVELRADIVVPEGAGALQLKFEELKRRLEAEGLFDASRKRPLPAYPKTIGVVTSPSGAVFHDICQILKRRYPLAHVVLAATPVQGDAAAPAIVAALEGLNRRGGIDVVILARGGGSLEELWPFNEESVARAIYASKIPVISAIGHETDVTIADYVADLRAPTPSAAAELVAPDVASLRSAVADMRRRAIRAAASVAQSQRHELDSRSQRLRGLAPDVGAYRHRVDEHSRTAARALASHLSLLKERVSGLERRTASLDPRETLKRGYAIVQRDPAGAIITRVGQVRDGETLNVTVSDGAFPARAGDGAKRKQERRKSHAYAGEPLL